MAGNKPEVVKAGYWWSESSFRPPANINTDLFTHLFCAFAELDPTTHQITLPSSKQPQISTFSAAINQKNPHIKTLLSIAAKPETFASMASQSSRRKAFIDSSISLARQCNFHGLDLHWLVPSKLIEMTNLGRLLDEWRDAVSSESQRRRLPALLLVATVFYSPYPNSLVYPIAAMKASLDWINVAAYDLYTPVSSAGETGPVAGFFNSKTTTLSVDYGIKQWIEKEFPADCIVLGVPFYGWAWLLMNTAKHGPFSPTDGPAPAMAGVSADGRIDYADIRKVIRDFCGRTVYDDKGIFSYVYYETNWIGYDDENSVSAKILQARKLGLLGYFAWHVGGDDEYATLATQASQQWDA